MHQATKAERQLQEDAKLSKSTSFAARPSYNGGKFSSKVQPSNKPTIGGSSNSQASASKTVENSPRKSANPAASSVSSSGSTGRSSAIQCHKCLGRGYMQRDCPNNKVVLVTEAGEYESASEDEYDEHAVDLTKLEYAQDEDREVVPLYCDAPNVPLLVCAPKILSV